MHIAMRLGASAVLVGFRRRHHVEQPGLQVGIRLCGRDDVVAHGRPELGTAVAVPAAGSSAVTSARVSAAGSAPERLACCATCFAIFGQGARPAATQRTRRSRSAATEPAATVSAAATTAFGVSAPAPANSTSTSAAAAGSATRPCSRSTRRALAYICPAK